MSERSRVRGPLLAAVVPAAVGVLSFFGDEPLRDQWHPLIAINVAVAVGLSLATALLAREPRHSATAVLLGLATACSVAGWLRVRMPNPLPYVTATMGPLFWVFAGWALLRYPLRRLEQRSERIFITCAGVWLFLGHLIANLWQDPSWYPLRWYPGTWWPTVGHSQSVFDRWQLVLVAVDALFATWYVVLALQRIRRLSGVDRWILAPLAASIVAAGVPLLLRPIAFAVDNDRAKNLLSVVMNLALVLIPIALITVIVRRSMTRTVVADMATRLTDAAGPADVRAALRMALRDPTLDVAFWVPETDGYVDPFGAAVALPAQGGRLRFPLHDPQGLEYGLILADERLETNRELVAAAVSAASLALRIARLQAALQAQLDQVGASRRRMAEVALTERRRLERDLHDGVQQRLLALALQLAQMKATGVEAEDVIDRTRTELHASLGELRDLASGIHPPVLAQSGLRVALEEVLDRLPFPVHLSIEARRWTALVESTAYYVICESLTNVVKHADATGAWVSVRSLHGGVQISVDDDGRGGAEQGSGSGLTGLADRVRAVGGRFELTSRPGAGTSVVAWLPCE